MVDEDVLFALGFLAMMIVSAYLFHLLKNNDEEEDDGMYWGV